MTTFQPNTEGVFYDLPAAEYHKAPGFSNSMGKHIEPTPAHLIAYLTKKREPTTAMILGTLVHSAILEPYKPLPKIVVPPETYPAPADCTAVKTKKAQIGDPLDWSWSAKYCKRWFAEAEEAGMIVLSQSEYDSLLGMIARIKAHPVCRKIFASGKSEVSLFKQFNLGGTCLRKARLDFVPEGNFLADIKTCQDASKEEFCKTIDDQDYHTQAASNLDIWNDCNPNDRKEHFVIIAVEKAPPYLVACYRIKNEFVGLGRAKHTDRLATYVRCCANGVWPGYPEEIVDIDLPEYRKSKQQ